MNGKESVYLKQLHDAYGHVVRVRPDALSYNSAQAWRDIYGTRAGKNQIPRDKQFFFGDGDGIADIIVSNDVDHARIRRLLAYAFSEQALRGQEPLVTKYIDLMVSKLHGEIAGSTDGIVDMARWYNFTTFDIIGDLCFGESFHALDTGNYHPWVSNIFAGVKISRFIRVARAYPTFGAVLFFVVSLFPSIMEAARKHQMYTVERTEQRLDMKTDRTDFMSYVLRHNDEKGMSRMEINKTSGLLIIAGKH